MKRGADLEVEQRGMQTLFECNSKIAEKCLINYLGSA